MKSNAAKKAIGVLKEWSIVLALILVWAVLSFLSPHFLQWSNISNIFLQSSHIMMCAIGMTFILIDGQMDLSIGSVEALSGTICALTLVNLGLPFIPGVILACCAGVLRGRAVRSCERPARIALQVPAVHCNAEHAGHRPRHRARHL